MYPMIVSLSRIVDKLKCNIIPSSKGRRMKYFIAIFLIHRCHYCTMEKPTILSRGEQENNQNTIMTKTRPWISKTFFLELPIQGYPSFFTQKMSPEEEVTDLICLFVFKHFVVSPCSSFLSPFSDAGKRKT